MKKILCIALCLLYVNAMAQGILDRFNDPEKGAVVFIEKGNRALGISGGYRNFTAGGDVMGDGYSVLSLLNIGTGKLATYNVSPSFSYFLADDLSLGVKLDYSGYTLNTDLRLDLRNIINLNGVAEDDPDLKAELNDILNLRISGRHMVRNAWGASLALRKYMSFFGSQTFGIFGEARLYGNYGRLVSCPLEETGALVEEKLRTSNTFSTGLKIAAGVAVKLRDNSALSVSIPIIGASYSFTKQHKNNTGNNAHMSQFKVARDIDFLAIQVGYTHYIKSKR